WDLFTKDFLLQDDSLFLKVWFFVMFVFFSLSAGKRPVYLLPFYSALSLLFAGWFHHPVAAYGVEMFLFPFVAGVAVVGGAGVVFYSSRSFVEPRSRMVLHAPRSASKGQRPRQSCDRQRCSGNVRLVVHDRCAVVGASLVFIGPLSVAG